MREQHERREHDRPQQRHDKPELQQRTQHGRQPFAGEHSQSATYADDRGENDDSRPGGCDRERREVQHKCFCAELIRRFNCEHDRVQEVHNQAGSEEERCQSRKLGQNDRASWNR